MDTARFDRLARRLATSSSRRAIVLGGTTLAHGLGWHSEMTLATARGDEQDRERQKRSGTCRGLRGGVVATFDVAGERFRVWVTNPLTIQQILDLRDGTSQATIPNGRLLRGSGRRRHNALWHWHLDQQDIEMAEATIELCDGLPSYVEANRDEFIAQVGRFCPWAAQLATVLDCR